MNAPPAPDGGYEGTRVDALLRQGARTLAALPSPRLDAELLLAAALGVARSALYAHPERRGGEAATVRYRADLAHRARGVPLAYLTGEREFWSMRFEVSPATLVPRPETEGLVERALECLDGRPEPRVADLGTGCGAVAIALGRERPDARIAATDLSEGALALARVNRDRLGAPNVGLVRSSWLDGFGSGAFDLVVSNPPYVADDNPCLAGRELAHEPRLALAAGPDGLAALAAIVAGASRCLGREGWLVLEHGWDQAPAVRALLERGGFARIETTHDLAGRDRVTRGRLRSARGSP